MNILLRNIKGESLELVEGYRFIELLTDEGKIAAVVYLDDSEEAHTITGDMDDKAKHYSKMFGVEFADNPINL